MILFCRFLQMAAEPRDAFAQCQRGEMESRSGTTFFVADDDDDGL